MSVYLKTTLKVHKRDIYYQIEFLLDLLNDIADSEESYEAKKVISEIQRLRAYRKGLDNIKNKEVDLKVFTFHSKINTQL